MSNTDGEDTQKVSLGELLLNAGTRIVDLEKQSNDQVEIITHLDQELASLREQLKQKDLEAKYWLTQSKTLQSDLKQKEDENRELLIGLHDLFDPLMVSSEFRKLYPGTCKNLESLIHKHKKNLSA